MNEKSSIARKGYCHRGYSREQQHQNARAQDAYASCRIKGQGQGGAGEDGKRGRHRGQAVAGATDFFADLAGFAGATSLVAGDGSIDGIGRSVSAAIKAVSSFHNASGTFRT